jgi:hypothetical protein
MISRFSSSSNYRYEKTRNSSHIDARRKKPTQSVRFDVLAAIKVSMLAFWLVAKCEFLGRYQHFGRTCCLHFQSWSTEFVDHL